MHLDIGRFNTFGIKTFGCKVNQYESEFFRECLAEIGLYELDEKEAELLIINTCCVTEQALVKLRKYIKHMLRLNPDRQILLIGCGTRYRGMEKFIKDLPVNVIKDGNFFVSQFGFQSRRTIYRFEGHTRAFVKIQDGCNQCCSYCIIPFVRGEPRSRDKDEILREVEDLLNSGYKEIVLTGIHIGNFSNSPTYRLPQLLKDVISINKEFRVRLSSIEMHEVTQELMELVRDCDKVCPHLHIPLQSGDNRILSLMNRGYTYSAYKKVIEKVREYIPGIVFTTDIIVGFPSETEQEFINSIKAVKEVRFMKVHVFPYSDRDGTKASQMEGKVNEKQIRVRVKKLDELAIDAGNKVKEEFIGTVQRVLVEKLIGEDSFGHLDNYIPVLIKGKLSVGEFYKIKIVGREEEKLISELI